MAFRYEIKNEFEDSTSHGIMCVRIFICGRMFAFCRTHSVLSKCHVADALCFCYKAELSAFHNEFTLNATVTVCSSSTQQPQRSINCRSKQISKSQVNLSIFTSHTDTRTHHRNRGRFRIFIDLLMEVKNDGKFISCWVAHFKCHKYPKKKKVDEKKRPKRKAFSCVMAWTVSTLWRFRLHISSKCDTQL